MQKGKECARKRTETAKKQDIIFYREMEAKRKQKPCIIDTLNSSLSRDIRLRCSSLATNWFGGV